MLPPDLPPYLEFGFPADLEGLKFLPLKAAFNGNLTYKGQLLGVEGEKVKLKSKNIEMFFDYSNIKNAKLVLTDDMFRALLNKKD